MANFVNKKKIRGWKRQIRKLQALKNEYLNLDLDNLHKSGYDYVKIWIDPWYRLVKRNPPLKFKRNILEAFIEIYDSWHEQLLQKNIPFYLKIWVFEPQFYKTQVVAALGERMKYYDTLFTPEEKSKSLPKELYSEDNSALRDFEWQLCVDEEAVSENEELLDEDFLAWLKANAWRVEKTPNDITLYIVRQGNIWVGSRKNV